MGILVDSAIVEAVKRGDILIEPFSRSRVGPNSLDVCLAEILAQYDDETLDSASENRVSYLKIPQEGFVLKPDDFYLGVTVECVGSSRYVPLLEGKSSAGKLSINVHSNAGFGDLGFIGHWTFNITVARPVRIYARMPIAQISFHEAVGGCQLEIPYSLKRGGANYMNGFQENPRPTPSGMWKNFLKSNDGGPLSRV
ncbi:MAG TPA: dCTP deaminase [Candidatus Nanoarchaeia archaeon]|nr:dCTP deaminase [Candidatus Nanoarchaeia archaeon]